MKKICECKAICVFHGEGVLMLTDDFLAWNKSALSFIMFGVAAAMSDNSVSINLSDIAFIDRYLFIGGGGLKVTTNTGEVFKFSIKSKNAYNLVFDYLNQRVGNDDNE